MPHRTSRWTWSAMLSVLVAGFAFAAADAANILKPTNKPESWRFEQHEQAKGKIAVEADAIVLEATETDGTDWHVQAFQTPLDLKEGKDYVLTYQAKADGARSVNVQAAIDEDPWSNAGLDEPVELTKEWKKFEHKFTARDIRANKNRVGFVIGNEKGKVFIKDMVLKPA